MKSRSFGICLGASTIKVAMLIEDERGIRVDRTIVRGHESNPRDAFVNLLREIDIDERTSVMLTGRKFKNIVNAPFITEPEAIEHALAFHGKNSSFKGHFSSVASLGAESFIGKF